jgi:hypothetical protein
MSIDSDSDDDLPIFELIKKRKRLELLKSGKPDNKNNNNNVIKPEKVTRSERVSADRGNGSKGNSSSNSSSSNTKSSSSYVNVAAEFYDTTKKGKLSINTLLSPSYSSHLTSSIAACRCAASEAALSLVVCY